MECPDEVLGGGSVEEGQGMSDDSAPWASAYSCVHAGGHQGQHEGTDQPVDGRTRLPTAAGQHLPPEPQARSPETSLCGRTPPVHELASQHPYRFRWIPNGQSLPSLFGG